MAEKKPKLTDKQRLFCHEYLIDQNAKQAAIRAGYSKRTAKCIGAENLSKPYLRAYIDELMAEHQSELVATEEEVLQYLTSVLRGESTGEEIVYESQGSKSTPKRMLKGPSEIAKLKAAEQLSKCYGLHTDKRKLDMDRERLELEKQRLELEKRKVDEGSTDKDIKMVIEDFDESWCN